MSERARRMAAMILARHIERTELAMRLEMTRDALDKACAIALELLPDHARRDDHPWSADNDLGNNARARAND